MNKEFSAGAVIFKKEKNDVLFLVVYSRRNNIWGFPKGHIEQAETEKEAAAREIKEEAGLENLHFIDGFREEIVYDTISKRHPFKGQSIEKHAIYFLCETENRDIIVDGREIGDYRFLPLNEAEQMVKFHNLNATLRRAHDFLSAA